jgi:uncharacterized protein YecT (DUF1311 family)
VIVAALLLVAAPVDDPSIDCDNQRYQVEMNYCARQAYERADAAMNVQWKLTVAAMRERDRHIDRKYDSQPTHDATLLASQRAWLTYRDQQCLNESFAARGGSMAPMLHSGCMERLTKARTAELKALVEEY